MLDWRRAEKNFDPTKPTSEEDLNKVLHAIQMAPSSFGIQPYHIYVVSDPETKKKMRAAAWDQAQFEEASHILVFASRTDAIPRIDEYLEVASGGDAEKREKLKGYEDMMKGFLSNFSPEVQRTWADRQTYIALGFAMAAAAELKLDSCPMEGFTPAEFDNILDLPENLKSVVTMSLGHRASEDGRPKVRFPETELFTHV